MRICGIDPGLKGAIAFADVSSEGFSNISVYDMPVSDDVDGRDQPDEIGISAILASEKPDFAILEHVSPRPKSGPVGEWRFAMGFAATRVALRLYFATAFHDDPRRLHLVRPNEWKKSLGLSSEKDDSLIMARMDFPSMSEALKLKKHDGRAEALLLLKYHQTALLPLGGAGIEVC